jgi:hypothetical protein
MESDKVKVMAKLEGIRQIAHRGRGSVGHFLAVYWHRLRYDYGAGYTVSSGYLFMKDISGNGTGMSISVKAG